MGVCKKCGKELQQGAMICRNCGTRVIPDTSSGKKAVKASKVQPKMEEPKAQEPKAQPRKSAKKQEKTDPESTVMLPPEVHEPDELRAVMLDNSKVLSTGAFLGMFLLMMIPLVNIILLIVWACGKGNLNRKHWAAAMLILQLIAVLLLIAVIILYLQGFLSFLV